MFVHKYFMSRLGSFTSELPMKNNCRPKVNCWIRWGVQFSQTQTASMPVQIFSPTIHYISVFNSLTRDTISFGLSTQLGGWVHYPKENRVFTCTWSDPWSISFMQHHEVFHLGNSSRLSTNYICLRVGFPFREGCLLCNDIY